MDQSLENILQIHSFNLKKIFFWGGDQYLKYLQIEYSIEKGYVNYSKVMYQIKATHLVPRKAET